MRGAGALDKLAKRRHLSCVETVNPPSAVSLATSTAVRLPGENFILHNCTYLVVCYRGRDGRNFFVRHLSGTSVVTRKCRWARFRARCRSWFERGADRNLATLQYYRDGLSGGNRAGGRFLRLHSQHQAAGLPAAVDRGVGAPGAAPYGTSAGDVDPLERTGRGAEPHGVWLGRDIFLSRRATLRMPQVVGAARGDYRCGLAPVGAG